MFCPKCGTEIPEGSQFCPNCGDQVNILATDVMGNNKTIVPAGKYIQPLSILSIIAIIWYIIGGLILSQVSYIDDCIVLGVLLFGYALAYSIVALVQSLKYNIKAIKVMSIIGIIWYATDIIFINSAAESGNPILLIAGQCVYALVFSIVGLIKATK